jgi:heterodisulfide reductase subunit C
MTSENESKKPSLAFSSEVKGSMGGETVTLCYQCGTCASSCPVAKTTDRFNPREIIKLLLLGERHEVLSSGAIWLCCSCYNCQERCPQKVEIADVFYALRNIAISDGNIPNIYSEFAKGLMGEGRIVPISKFVEKKRADFGLPPIRPAGVDALRKILAKTGFDKIQRRKEEPS